MTEFSHALGQFFFLHCFALHAQSQWPSDLFSLRKGPGCPFDSQDPHRRSGENQHSPQADP